MEHMNKGCVVVRVYLFLRKMVHFIREHGKMTIFGDMVV